MENKLKLIFLDIDGVCNGPLVGLGENYPYSDIDRIMIGVLDLGKANRAI